MKIRSSFAVVTLCLLGSLATGCATQEELARAAAKQPRQDAIGSNIPSKDPTGNATTVDGKTAADALRNRNPQPVNRTGG